MIRKIFFGFLFLFLCPLLRAEETPVPSSDDTDKIINESITPEKPVEKQQSYRYKKAKIKKANKKGKKAKKVKKAKKAKAKKKIKKVRAQDEQTQSGM